MCDSKSSIVPFTLCNNAAASNKIFIFTYFSFFNKFQFCMWFFIEIFFQTERGAHLPHKPYTYLICIVLFDWSLCRWEEKASILTKDNKLQVLPSVCMIHHPMTRQLSDSMDGPNKLRYFTFLYTRHCHFYMKTFSVLNYCGRRTLMP